MLKVQLFAIGRAPLLFVPSLILYAPLVSWKTHTQRTLRRVASNSEHAFHQVSQNSLPSSWSATKCIECIPVLGTSKAPAFKNFPGFRLATANTLAGSEITLQLWCSDGRYTVKAFEAATLWLLASKLLRCKSFQVLSPAANGPIHHCRSARTADELVLVDTLLDDIRHFATEITSHTKPVDLYMDLFMIPRALVRSQLSSSDEHNRA